MHSYLNHIKLKHYMLLKRWKAVNAIVEHDYLDDQGYIMALRLACRHKAPKEVILKVLEYCPESAKAIDRNKRLPLHTAARNGASPEVIRILFKAYPSAIRKVDDIGMTPLLCSFNCRSKNKINCKTVDALIRLRPKMLLMKDIHGNNALESILFGNLKVPEDVFRVIQHRTASYSKKLRFKHKSHIRL